MSHTTVTTEWARAGGGFWRRERGAVLWVRTHFKGASLVEQIGCLRLDIFYKGIFVIQDTYLFDEEMGKQWCDRWVDILIREVDSEEPKGELREMNRRPR